MRLPDQLVIVQRYQPALYKTLRQANRGRAEVLFDRRRGGVYAGLERRQGARRRALSANAMSAPGGVSYVISSESSASCSDHSASFLPIDARHPPS